MKICIKLGICYQPRTGSYANDLIILETKNEFENFSTNIQKYFTIHFTCAANESQLELVYLIT